MPNTVTYPFDPTGLAATNLVANEQHTLTSVNSTTYRLIIPKFAPFHVNNFEMVHITMDGVETPLTEGVDFNFVFLYLGASRSIGTVVYGGITLLNELVDGYIKIKRYQTLGGEWCCDQQYVLNLLADIVFNPRTVPWEKLTNVQQVFPPINHDQAMDWIKGHDDLIQAVNGLADTIVNGGQLREQNLSLLIRNMVMTAVQVGLGDVQNLPLATMAEVNASQPVNKYITLAQAISLVNNQISRLNQAGGAITTQNISDFAQATTQIINSYLTQNPPTVSASSISGLSHYIENAINAFITTGDTVNLTDLITVSIEEYLNSNPVTIDPTSINGLNQFVTQIVSQSIMSLSQAVTSNTQDLVGIDQVLQSFQDALVTLRNDFLDHNHDATTLDNLPAAVFYTMGAAFSNGFWMNRNGVVGPAVEGVDFPGLGTLNNWTGLQVPSRNSNLLSAANNVVDWDIRTTQVLRLNLDNNVTALNIQSMDQSTLGAEVKLVVLNNGGVLAWPVNVLFSGGTPPPLTMIAGKYDIFTFIVESPDGINWYLLNTGSSNNL